MHGESHGQRSLADYRPWRCRVSRHTCILLSAMCPCLGNLTSICLSFLSVRWILPCSLLWGENNNTRKVLTSVYNMFIAVTVSPCLNILIQTKLVSVQSLWLFGSVVAQSCPTLCDPMDCSMPGFPVHHQLLELAQTLVQPVNDAIPPSHPLSSPSPPALNPSHNQRLTNESVLLIRWPKYWSFGFSISPASEYSGLISWESESSVGLGKIKLMKFAWVMEVDVYSNLFYVVIRLKIRFPEERLLR